MIVNVCEYLENSWFVLLQSISSSAIIRVWKTQQLSPLMASTIADIPMVAIGQNRTTIELYRVTGNVGTATCTLISGNPLMAQSQRAMLSITLTKILRTTILATLPVSLKKNIWQGIVETLYVKQKNGMMRGLGSLKSVLTYGKKPKRARRLCRNMGVVLWQIGSHLTAFASNVASHLPVSSMARKSAFVQQNAIKDIASLMGSLQKNVLAPIAESLSQLIIDGRKLDVVLLHVLSLIEEEHKQPIYNLTINNTVGEELTNGIIVRIY